MSEKLPTERYNYDSFVQANFGPLMRFPESPPVGKPGPDFPIWNAKTKEQKSLSDIWKGASLLVVEFGSFT